MKKYWPLLLIIGILAAIIGMSQYADSAKNHYEEGAKHTKGTSVAKVEDKQAGNDTEKTYQPPVWAKFVTWPEGVGAWAVILTLLAIAWQSIETRRAADAAIQNNTDTTKANAAMLTEIQRQANVMERQAKVMEDQAEVLINSERAWILMEVDQARDLVEYRPNTVDRVNLFRFTMTNNGKTVARPKKIQATTFCLPDDGIELPTDPVYVPQNDYPPEQCGVLTPMGKGPVIRMSIRRLVDAALIDRMKHGHSTLYLFGHIEYYDFSKELRVLNFCYRYTSEGERFYQDVPAKWVLAGPYNSHT